jgi:hypothetical protein
MAVNYRPKTPQLIKTSDEEAFGTEHFDMCSCDFCWFGRLGRLGSSNKFSAHNKNKKKWGLIKIYILCQTTRCHSKGDRYVNNQIRDILKYLTRFYGGILKSEADVPSKYAMSRAITGKRRTHLTNVFTVMFQLSELFHLTEFNRSYTVVNTREIK